VAPGLASVRVGEVELDDDAVERGERVVQRPGVVGEGTGVDDDRRVAPARAVDGLDQVGLGVGLDVVDREAVLFSGGLGGGVPVP